MNATLIDLNPFAGLHPLPADTAVAPENAPVPDAAAGLFEPDERFMDELYDRIVPPEPPEFLRKPSQSFMRTLFAMGGLDPGPMGFAPEQWGER